MAAIKVGEIHVPYKEWQRVDIEGKKKMKVIKKFQKEDVESYLSQNLARLIIDKESNRVKFQQAYCESV